MRARGRGERRLDALGMMDENPFARGVEREVSDQTGEDGRILPLRHRFSKEIQRPGLTPPGPGSPGEDARESFPSQATKSG